MLKLQGQSQWYLYYDYWAGGRYGVMKSVDMVHWSDELPEAFVRFPYQRRHATFFSVTEEELFKLLRHFSLVAHLRMDEAGSGVIDADFMQGAFALRSISMWVKAVNVKGTQMLYVEGGADTGLALKIEDGRLQAAAAGRGGRAVVSVEFSDSASWHHVAVVFSEGSLKLYLDGKFASSALGGFISVDEHPGAGGLGRRISEDAFGGKGDGALFEGILDDVEIFNTSLQAEDVYYLFARR